MNIFASFRRLSAYCADIFTREENLAIGFISFLSLLSAVLEIVTIGGLVPFVNIFAQGGHGLEQGLGASILSRLPVMEPRRLIIYLGFFLVIVSVTKVLLNLYLVYSQTKLATSIQSRLSILLLRNYALSGYAFHLTANSSVLVKNITVETNNIYFFVGSLVRLLMNSVMAAGILGFLLYINYRITLAISVLFVVVAGLSVLLVGKRAKQLGYQREDISKSTYKLASQVLKGIKEIKIDKVEDYFVERFSKVVARLVPVASAFVTLSSAPRFMLEIFIYVGGISFLLIVTLIWGVDKDFLGLFVAFLAAVYKLAPAFSAISASAIEIRYAVPSLDIMASAIKAESVDESPREPRIELAEIRSIRAVGVGLKYPGREVLSNVNFQIDRGDKVVVVGKTGTGKSSLNNLLTGLISPTSGQIWFNDTPLSAADPYSVSRRVGYLPQETMILDDDIAANICFGVPPVENTVARINEILRIVDLERFVGNLAYQVGENGCMLSGGERQRIAIARLLYKNPEIIILDEITSALDHRTEDRIIEDVLNIFKEKTVVMVTHSTKVARKFSKAYRIEHGTLVEISRDQLLD